MSDVLNHESLLLIIGFVLPGLIASVVRSQFLTGRSPAQSEAILSYVALSIVYLGFSLPVVELIPESAISGPFRSLVWFGMIFAGPAFFGALLGVGAQKGFGRRLLRLCGLNGVVHVVPSAWDWRFSGAKDT